jgi:hypothetical protein
MRYQIKHRDIEFDDVCIENATVTLAVDELFQSLEDAYGDDIGKAMVNYFGDDIVTELVELLSDIEIGKLMGLVRIDECPHCGSTSGVVHVKTNGEIEEASYPMYQVICDAQRTNDFTKRPGCGSSSGYKTKAIEAIVLWNTRKKI